jgi:penicillin amidase
MGLWLAGNWQRELARQSLSKTLPAERIAELWPPHRYLGPQAPATIDPRLADAAAHVLNALPYVSSGESNGWAVSGTRSATGHPLLAGDPHLLYLLPGIWYLARIERPDGVWAGATAAGVPGIVMGRNSQIAWTFTTTGADTQDVFIETPAGDGQYITPDGPQPFVTRKERIRVRGQPDVVLLVRETRHGPIISDIAPQPDGPLLSVAIASLAPGETAASGFLALNRAHSVAEAGNAAAIITSPVQNMLVADADSIALFTTGRVPLRRAGDGSMPVAGADGSHDWIGFAAGDRLPVIIDPSNGWLLNANEPVAPADFPVFLGGDAEGRWRADRMEALLSAPDKHTVDDFARMQTDVGSTYARQILPVLRGVAVGEGMPREAATLLRDWDGTMTTDSAGPLIFNAWLARFRDDVLHRAGVPERSPAVSRLGFVAWLLSPSADPAKRAFWCGGDCGPMLAHALDSAATDLAARLGPDPAAWRWGDVHEAVFAHPVLRFVPLLGRLVEARIAIGGDTTTINRQEALFGGFESVHGGAYRGVYDLADLDRSRFMTVPGQSGNPLSSTARVFLRRWQAGDTIPLGPELSGSAMTAQIRLMPRPAN